MLKETLSSGTWKHQQRIVGRSWESNQETVMIWTTQSGGAFKKLESSRNIWKAKLTGFAVVPMESVKENPC